MKPTVISKTCKLPDGREITIETGKLADLILLDADPLAEIRNTTRINAVVVDGRLLDRRALDRLLIEVKREFQKLK